MHGPYTAHIDVAGDVVVLTEDELREAQATACRFYDSAAVGCVDGALRCATFAAAALLGTGEDAVVVIRGFEGSGNARPIDCREVRARRDDRGEFLATLGSRFNERLFVGV